jgi:hypothetical protein
LLNIRREKGEKAVKGGKVKRRKGGFKGERVKK